jgi:hypothetical protein
LAVSEVKSLTEVQQWDLEQLDAFLAILDMKNGTKAAANAFAAKDTGGSKNGRG